MRTGMRRRTSQRDRVKGPSQVPRGGRFAEILIATSNPGKLREIRRMLRESSRLRIRLLCLKDVEDRSIPTVAPKETGRNFRENACIKAAFYACKAGRPAYAEDSGLCVDALDGEPGVRSARFLGADATDNERCERLLRLMEAVQGRDRSAHFTAAGAIAMPDGEIVFSTEASCPGLIATAPRGPNGFGYDPIFLYRPAGITFAEMTVQQKNRVSHRSRLLRKLVRFLAG